MSISVPVASGGQNHFGNSVSVSKNVGTGSNRYAIVLATYSASPGAGGGTPSTATVGSDTLTLQGSVQTDGTGRKSAIFSGALTQTGTQPITANFTGSISSGFAEFVCLVLQGTNALTLANFTAPANGSNGGSGTDTITVTSTSGDTVFELSNEYGYSISPTAGSGTSSVTNDAGPPGVTTWQATASSSSTAINVSWPAAYDACRSGFSVTEAAGAGSGLVALERITRGQFRGQY
jgi:hypothetical protein